MKKLVPQPMPIRGRRQQFRIASVNLLLMLCVLGIARAQKPADAPPGQPSPPHAWRPISDQVLDSLSTEGKKLGYPGGTAGVSVDRVTGNVRMIVPDQGIWTSTDGGAKFTRIDDGSIGGRCETGYALNADPAGRRLACFMLDGKSAMTLDNGKTWSAFQQMGRGWDYGVVDWSQATPQVILAVHIK